jgi:hypothetical protein
MKSPRFRAGGFLCPFVRGGFVRVPAARPMRRGFLCAFVRGGFPAALPRRTCSVLEARPQRTGNFSDMERILPEVYFRKSG